MTTNNSDGDIMSKAFKLSNGRFGTHPDEKSVSVKLRHRFYTSSFRCPTCNMSSLRVTNSDNCMMCQRVKIEVTRCCSQYSDGMKWPEHVDSKYNTPEFMKEVIEAVKVIRDEGLMLHSDPCKTHGHIRLGDDCHFCTQLLKPREQAIKDGNDTYISTSKCVGCNTLTMRNVTDKSCVECGHVPNTTVETTDTIMMRDAPTMIISKQDADEFGFKVYRTGNPCRKGHNGWRYVSTGNCIDCIKEG